MASKIKVDTLETANGSGTIALSNQLSGMTSASMPSGSVIQAITSGSSDFARTTISSAGSWVNTNNVLSITPSSSSSKILVLATQPVLVSGTGSIMRGGVRLLRSINGQADAVVWNVNSNVELVQIRNASGEFNVIATINLLESSGTTEAVTFRLQAYLTTGTSFVAWESVYGANITLIEIKG